ncbi:GNAT family N-acetyltransferase [Wenxinia saemankumensis]|uniref:Acetyltransferase (GNAT) family protein n=1 Tax=Wenxinia saemankumensis TaxID=1447782 RepID=A0A1M6DU91_9RHOB|nr:GNAT family N-acetyltransferase [Wenxinia saemankumensis]SHI76772.1 Acetyltransferase (GNAT) family protein [Wenxinia saemankumensis]
MRVGPARSEADHAAVRALLGEFRDWLDARYPDDLALIAAYYPREGYAALLSDLPRLHAPPGGDILLARDGEGAPVGCCMFGPGAAGIAELKRMFVTPGARGRGIGRALIAAAIGAARRAGYRRMRLDTGPLHCEAQALYRACGFVERGPWGPVPAGWEGRLVHFERAI